MKQATNIDLFVTKGRHHNIDKHYIPQSFFHLPKKTNRKKLNIFILFKRTLGDMILPFHDIAGLDVNLEERSQPCLKAWENETDSSCI